MKADPADKTEEKLRRYGNLVPFQAGAGWRGNRGGRPKGARSALSEAFLGDLSDMWETHGPTILLMAARESPLKFTEAVASLIPKHFQVDVGVGELPSYEEALRALG